MSTRPLNQHNKTNILRSTSNPPLQTDSLERITTHAVSRSTSRIPNSHQPLLSNSRIRSLHPRLPLLPIRPVLAHISNQRPDLPISCVLITRSFSFPTTITAHQRQQPNIYLETRTNRPRRPANRILVHGRLAIEPEILGRKSLAWRRHGARAGCHDSRCTERFGL